MSITVQRQKNVLYFHQTFKRQVILIAWQQAAKVDKISHNHPINFETTTGVLGGPQAGECKIWQLLLFVRTKVNMNGLDDTRGLFDW